MTEITVDTKNTYRRHMIDPLAFFAALAAAPVAVTLTTFWMLGIPVFALILGGPIYLVMAVPVLLWWLSWRAPKIVEIAALGFAANLAACAAIYGYSYLTASYNPTHPAMMYLIFGSVFAPVWSGMFAWFYRGWRRPFFAQTV